MRNNSYANPNAPTSINGTFLTYDHTGQRVLKDVGTTTTRYPSDLYGTDGTTLTKHIYAAGELVATIDTLGATSTVQYLHTDHLGSVTAATNVRAEIAEATDYYPYGDERFATGSFEESRKYIGQEYDAESDLSYLNARYYDGDRGQFVSQDPVFLRMGVDPRTAQVLQDPQLMNSYSYGRNNPVVNKDPEGECPLCVPLLAGMFAGGVGLYVNDVLENRANGESNPYKPSSSWHEYNAAVITGGSAAVAGTYSILGAGAVAAVGSAAQQRMAGQEISPTITFVSGAAQVTGTAVFRGLMGPINTTVANQVRSVITGETFATAITTLTQIRVNTSATTIDAGTARAIQKSLNSLKKGIAKISKLIRRKGR